MYPEKTDRHVNTPTQLSVDKSLKKNFNRHLSTFSKPTASAHSRLRSWWNSASPSFCSHYFLNKLQMLHALGPCSISVYFTSIVPDKNCIIREEQMTEPFEVNIDSTFPIHSIKQDKQALKSLDDKGSLCPTSISIVMRNWLVNGVGRTACIRFLNYFDQCPSISSSTRTRSTPISWTDSNDSSKLMKRMHRGNLCTPLFVSAVDSGENIRHAVILSKSTCSHYCCSPRNPVKRLVISCLSLYMRACKSSDSFSRPLYHPFCAFSTTFRCWNGVFGQVPTEPREESPPKSVLYSFDNYDADAAIARNFFNLHLEDCLPHFADQLRQSLLLGGEALSVRMSPHVRAEFLTCFSFLFGPLTSTHSSLLYCETVRQQISSAFLQALLPLSHRCLPSTTVVFKVLLQSPSN